MFLNQQFEVDNSLPVLNAGHFTTAIFSISNCLRAAMFIFAKFNSKL